MLARRLLLLAAVLLLLSALAAGLAPRQQVGTAPETERSALPPGTTLPRAISADPGADAKVKVHRGDLLQLEVSGDVLDSVLIERLDMMDAIAPLAPARFDLLIDAPAGVYPIRLVDADRRIGVIAISD